MNIEPTIIHLSAKKLIGISVDTSVSKDQTGNLFRQFMPRRKEIVNTTDTTVFSLQLYPADYFSSFDPAKVFTKWALVEVAQITSIPEGMEVFDLPAGKYALFHYKGLSSDHRIFDYIFSEWLPNSGYQLDQRPHFERLGEKFKVNDPNSEEEIWIPIQ